MHLRAPETAAFATGYWFDGAVDIMSALILIPSNISVQVAPSELEDLLRRHPSVQDCAVIGVPNEEAGELPRAYIVTRPEQVTTEGEINSYLADKVAAYKQLKGGIQFVDAIPRNPSGKILRKDLKAAATAASANGF